MNAVFRNDPIKLRTGVREEDFERFVAEELLPFFGKKYAGSASNSQTFLASQSLLKGTRDPRKYQWITVWSGPAERIQGASFELVLVEDNKPTETEALLKKLESFGQRFPASVLAEVAKQSAAPEASTLPATSAVR
jgi:enterochelin esterase-like enzyme